MKVELCLPLALLFLTSGLPSNAQNTESTEAAASERAVAVELGEPVVYFDRSFELNCTNPNLARDTYLWRKNETEVSKLKELGELRYELLEGDAVLRVKPAHEQDFGNYSCVSGGGHQHVFRVWGRPHAKLAANTNVVEGQKLKLTCKVVGKPAPEVTWFRNSSASDAEQPLAAGALEGRVTLETADGVPDSVLLLADAGRADAGEYWCVPGAAGVPATTTLRVKDMYAALWPFLGICAEVFVLCAIILVYEKRRTKPELDDSDTDNHDQ